MTTGTHFRYLYYAPKVPGHPPEPVKNAQGIHEHAVSIKTLMLIAQSYNKASGRTVFVWPNNRAHRPHL